MADSTSSRLRRLQLSASDLKKITENIKPGEPWPDALVEDYLNILNDLVLLADEIDQNATQIISSVNRAIASIAANKSLSAGNRARIGALKKSLSEINGRIDELGTEITGQFDFFPVKALMLLIDGLGGIAPSVTHSYNLDSITRSTTGTYLATLNQTTINGADIADKAVFAVEHKITPSANTAHFRVEADFISDSALVLSVYEVTVGTGSDLIYTLYDLQVGDWVSLSILMNAGSGTLPPA